MAHANYKKKLWSKIVIRNTTLCGQTSFSIAECSAVYYNKFALYYHESAAPIFPVMYYTYFFYYMCNNHICPLCTSFLQFLAAILNFTIFVSDS